ncbi:MAG: nitroreductase [Pseudomonadota bacterium]
MNDIENGPLGLLLTRRSSLVKDMVAPGPDADALEDILTAASRVPDHGKLEPWRFIVCQGEGRKPLGDAIANAIAREDDTKTPEMIERLREFPARAPVLVIVVSSPNTESRIPVWEQHLSAGAACQNLLLAATAMGFAAQWLTGAAAYSAGVHEYLGLEAHEQVAGFMFIGTRSDRPLAERPRPDLGSVVSYQ